MRNYFEVTASFLATLENGTEKKVSEHFLLDAISFSEAEYKTIAHLKDDVTELFIKDIKRRNYEEVITDETSDKWYEVKINLITLDEKTGAEKKSPILIAVQASSSDNAASVAKIAFKDTMNDWEIHTIRETKIVEQIQDKEE